MTTVTAIIQARVGSTRLPGKVMYPLDGKPALQHVIDRVSKAESVDNVVVATSTESQDNVLKQYVPMFGADIIRGSEANVLSRFELVTKRYKPNVLVRITGDCPLIDPKTIDQVVTSVRDEDIEYASNIFERTFPRGLDVEAFDNESFDQVISAATTQAEREHVTLYYRENPNEFNTKNIYSNEVFDDEIYINRNDLRLTLDEADDYYLLEQIYSKIEYESILPIEDAIDFVDSNNLSKINQSVRQKKI